MEKLNKVQSLINLFQEATLTLLNEKKASLKDIENIIILYLADRLSFDFYYDSYCLEIFSTNI